MNIGHFMSRFWEPGGISNYLMRVTSAQRQAGHRVELLDDTDLYCSLDDPLRRTRLVAPENLADRARSLGLDVLHLHTSVDPWPEGGPPCVRTVHEHRPYCPSGERYLRVSQRPCDRDYSLGGCLLSHLLEHCGSLRPLTLAENFRISGLERRLLHRKATLAISRYMASRMLSVGFDPSTVRVLHNPAPTPRPLAPATTEGVPRFLYLGRLVRSKGLTWALRSLARVGRPVALDVAGDGPQRAELEEEARRLGLAESVTFHGWVDEAKIDELALTTRAVIFPALWHEPAGLATLDAGARGRAVIASRSGGIPEYAREGETALLVEPNDEAGLAQAILRLIDDPDLARRLGEAGHALISGPFSLANHVAELDRIYREYAL